MAEQDSKPDNPPAFPRLSWLKDRDPGGRRYDAETVGGMQLRDYFAAAVLPQVYATSVMAGSGEQTEIAEEAYELADAMLTARSKANQ